MAEQRQGTLDRHTEEAWRELRRQLADHAAAMPPHEPVRLGLAVDRDDEAEGAAPSVQLVRHRHDALRAETVSDAYLDDRWALGDAGNAALLGLGWAEPEQDGPSPADAGSDVWHLERPRDHADELAELAVRTLREVHGCLHPALLVVEGGFTPTGEAAPSGATERDAPGEGADGGTADRHRVTFSDGPEQLTELVAAVLAEGGSGPVEPDEDGDFPLRLGQSVLFVRVHHHEPTVELFAELVHDVGDPEAAVREVNVLNRELMVGSCHLDGDAVRFRFSHCAVPFSPLQLHLVLGRITSDLDERAELLASRVRGRRFLDVEAAEEELADAPDDASAAESAGGRLCALVTPPQEVLFPDEEPAHPMVPVLAELLAVTEPSPRDVAALFDGDVAEIAETIAAVRDEPPAEPDVAELIAVLRQALAYAAHKRADRVFGSRGKPGARGRYEQGSLLGPGDVGDPGLDLGLDG